MNNNLKRFLLASALLIPAFAVSQLLGSNQPLGFNFGTVEAQGSNAAAFAANKLLQKTVNYSGLEAPNEGEWGPKLQEAGFEAIKQGGFTAVRLPVKFSGHADAAAPYKLEPAFLARVDWAVQNTTKRGMAMIIDLHHFNELTLSPEANKARFLGLWDQIAKHYQKQPQNVIFELLNEPNDKLEPFWNEYAAAALAVVRKSNPNRTVIIGPNGWNSADRLADFKVPNDPNLIVTFHNYTPFEFTHQGADWVSPIPKVGTTWPSATNASLRPPWQNWSWDSQVTPTAAGIEIEYKKAWAGAYFHSDTAASGYSSLRLKTNRAIKLTVSCLNNSNGAKPKSFPIETQAGIVLEVPLTSCGDGKAFKDLMIQSNLPDAQPRFTLQTLELVGPKGSDGFISDAQGEIRAYLETASKWGKANNRPLFMGEFGSLDKGDMASRARWTAFTRSEAEKRGISWGYWEFDGGFGIWDANAKVWRPDLRKALTGK
jgi:endoglucanase